MRLKERIEGDLKEAMVKGEKGVVTALRGLKAVILDAEVASGKREEGLTDEEIEKLVAKEIKKRRESIEMYKASGRGDLVVEEEGEIRVFERYMPAQLSEDEVGEKIQEVLASMPGATMADMGRVIKEVKGLVGSGADGAVVARLTKEALSR